MMAPVAAVLDYFLTRNAPTAATLIGGVLATAGVAIGTLKNDRGGVKNT